MADVWREAAERLRICTEAESENRDNGLKALDFLWGNQWDDDVKNVRKIEGRPALTINHTNVQVSRLKNTLRQQRPRIKCHPVGDGADVDTAATVNGLIRHIETLSDASVAYDTGVGSAVDIGWGYWRILADYIDAKSFDQELKIVPIRNTFTVYMDPSARHPAGMDQNWCLITERITREEYKRLYPRAKNVEWSFVDAPGDMVLDWETKTHITLAEYYRIEHVKDVLCRFQDGSTKFRSELYDPEVMQAARMVIVEERPTTRLQVQWFRLNGTDVVDQRDLPGTHIPVIRCEGNVLDLNGRVRRKGMVYDLMDPARIYNYTETQKTERYALTPKAPWVGAEGQFDGHPEWIDANQKSYSTLVYKPVVGPNGELIEKPARTAPAAVEAGMAEWSASAERNLMSVAGMPQENPELQAKVIGGNKYLQRRQGMQDLVHFQYYDNQLLAMECTGSILLELIPFYYDTPRMQRIIGEDGVPEIVQLKQRVEDGGPVAVKNDPTVGRYDVVMDTGPGYATKREEAAENMVQLMGTPLGEVIVKTGADIVLRNMDFPGADELADRAMVTNPEALAKTIQNLPKQAQNIVGAIHAQMQQMQKELQQAQMELKYRSGIEQMKDDGQTKRKLIEAHTQIETTGMKVQSDDTNSQRDYQGWLHDIDTKRQTSLDTAEINAATQLLNTHVEAEHESRAADKLIKAGTEKTNGSGRNE